MKILPFVAQFQPALKGFRNILLDKWHLIQSQPNLGEIFKESPFISYRTWKSLKDTLVKAKLWRLPKHHGHRAGVELLCLTHFTHILQQSVIFTSLLWVLMGNWSLEGGQPKKNHGQPKTQNWLPKGQMNKKVSVEHWIIGGQTVSVLDGFVAFEFLRCRFTFTAYFSIYKLKVNFSMQSL